MRATTLLNQLLGIKYTRVVGIEFDEYGLIAEVEPTTRVPRCGGCGACVKRVKDRRSRKWRHLDLAGMHCSLRYVLRRVSCPRCGVTAEMVPWAEHGSWFTRPFEDMSAYLAQHASKTVVTNAMRIAWETVGAIAARVVERRLPGDRLDGLTHIGVDELSYRKHHEYVTVVVDHAKARVVWAAPGKNADTLRSFFSELGKERCTKLEAVTIDMSQAYITAVTEASPQAQIIFDRFHVQRLVQDAVDEVRRDEVRAAGSDDERKELKGTRWSLLKSFVTAV